MEGMKKFVAVAKPYLSDHHIAARLRWAHAHQAWTKEQWSRVIWSDESSICLGKLGARRFVLRDSNSRYSIDNLVPAFKNHKKSVTVWGCFFGNTLGPLHYFPEGSINSQTYMNFVEHSLLPMVEEKEGLLENMLGDDKLIFQQDNAPIHTSAKTKAFLEQSGLTTLSWPANSPDLNPIENIWHLFKRRV